MTRAEAIENITEIKKCEAGVYAEALEMAIKALEQKPYEKFESVKDHICKLAGDYKCWDNRLTDDEALELWRILEQEPCDKYIKEIDHLRKYIYKLETQIVEQEPCEDAISRQVVKEQMIKYGFNAPDMTVTEFVEALPSVSTEKTGRWEKLSVGYGCSECSLCTNIHGIQDFKYCPNCGAKMGVDHE